MKLSGKKTIEVYCGTYNQTIMLMSAIL